MAHTARDKDKLINRVRRIRGQLDAVARALEEERDCGEVMHSLTACRGALTSLTAEVLEGYIRDHILDSKSKTTRDEAAESLIETLKTYVR